MDSLPSITPPAGSSPADPDPVIASARNVSVLFRNTQALRNVSLDLRQNAVTAIIGPSGCGKTTMLRCFNRMNEVIEGSKTVGSILLRNVDVHHPSVDVIELRKRVGLVFQKSNPFHKSIFENVAYGLRLHRIADRHSLADQVETALRNAALWDEVKDRLHHSALTLSGGQQQRLCIARAIAIQPELLLMDEPASALDPFATMKIEELILDLKKQFTIAIVTHNMQQATRISDYTAFFYLGELVEYDTTVKIFSNPTHRQTEDYVTGRFG